MPAESALSTDVLSQMVGSYSRFSNSCGHRSASNFSGFFRRVAFGLPWHQTYLLVLKQCKIRRDFILQIIFSPAGGHQEKGQKQSQSHLHAAAETSPIRLNTLLPQPQRSSLSSPATPTFQLPDKRNQFSTRVFIFCDETQQFSDKWRSEARTSQS